LTKERIDMSAILTMRGFETNRRTELTDREEQHEHHVCNTS
jgi:hypothetical protein